MAFALLSVHACNVVAKNVRRAFLKSPENFSGPRTFRGTFRVCFSGSKKCFSKRPKASRYFRGSFRDGHILRAKRSSRFFDPQAVPVK